MIVIGICDGEQAVRSLLASFVERYSAQTGEEIRLLSYSTGEKLLKNYLLDLDLIFLEIPLNKVNGLRIAQHIRQMDRQVRVVFLTTVLSYVLEAYDVGASNYLLKPLGYDKFCKELNRAREEKRGADGGCFIEHSRQGLYKVYHREIRYIETSGKSTLIHTAAQDIPSTRQMKQFEQMFMGTALVRCHAAYIVNLHWFRKLEGSTLVLTDGTRLAVSRNRRPELLRQIQQIYGEEI